ncbi:hypothetical protein [Flavobacterium sp.]|uniref:hypothetical protein n=1 Tax=Flavobacterium sp. TaxID=239 RepID=UPI0028BF1334|nr:hypothetical protein [Flavobacterium sp.]
MNSKIDKLKRDGYSLDLGSIISQMFENYKKIALNGGLVILIASVALIVLIFGGVGIIYGFSDFTQSMMDLQPTNFSSVGLIGYIVGATLVGALMYPLTAGLIQMAHEAEMNREPNVSIAFEHYKSTYFKELFTAGLLIGFATNTISVLFQYMFLNWIGMLITYAIALLSVFTVQLIIFEKNKAIEAISNSFALVLKQPIMILVALIIAIVIACLGLIGLCIGIFFTMPIIYSTYYILYKNAVGIDNKTEIDEIGTTLDM